tara:strand:+ start:26875 stop:27123 length:249 start_codon:yes stop_codon:yes gene_type:complete
MDDQVDIRFIKIENYSLENRQKIQENEDTFNNKLDELQNDNKALHIKIGEQNTKIEMLKNLIDQYFTMEIDNIKESHAKRKV